MEHIDSLRDSVLCDERVAIHRKDGSEVAYWFSTDAEAMIVNL